VTADLTGSLRRAVRGRVTTDANGLTPFRRDESHLSGTPFAAVAPADPEDVVALVRWARSTRTALVARGGGTSLDGESVPAEGSVVVDLAGWSRLLELNPDELWARVEPGLVNIDLHRSLVPHGLFFPPNPGSWTRATIGGNVATNASGMRSFRYGPTRAWVREVEAVLGTGARVRLGSRVAKRSVGPDLLQMFVGSEGTLGIATEVTVRLAPLPAVRQGLVVPLPRRVSLARLAGALAHLPGSGLSAIEYLDGGCAATLSERRAAPWPSGASLLLLEVEAADAREAAHRLERVRRVLAGADADHGVTLFPDADELWTLRGASGDALNERMGEHIREDVAVPLSRVDALVAEIDRISRKERVPCLLFGHLGEGSLHPNYAVDPSTRTADRVRAALWRAARALGGTISAEHGIGAVKRSFLTDELGADAVALLWAVKRACDPDGVMNPGKLYPVRLKAGRRSSRSPSAREGGRVPKGVPTAGPGRVSRSPRSRRRR
jgi:D-lactate dehydrogenase (quinone)